MIKKYTILTLILSLITTQSYGMVNFFRAVFANKTNVVEKLFENFSFATEFLVTSSKSDGVKEEEERNQEDYFVEYNVKLFKGAKEKVEKGGMWRKIFKAMPISFQKISCKEILKEVGTEENFQHLELFLKDPEKYFRKYYKKNITDINEIKEHYMLGERKMSDVLRDAISGKEEYLRSDKPNLFVLEGPFGPETVIDVLMIAQHCKECGGW
jgi:hypothetical protein